MSSRLPATFAVVLLVLVAVAGVAEAAPAPQLTNNWNQWDDDARDGVTQGTTQLAIGVGYARVGASDHTVRLALEAEHLLRNRWGLVGNLAVPVGGEWVAPATLGVRFHFIPKFPLDPFAGVAGGVAWLQKDGLTATGAPLLTARAGLAFHYYGLFFMQIEGGYDFVRYARSGVALDRGGVALQGSLGVNF